MADFPAPPSMEILVNGVPLKDAMPTSLRRQINRAAVLNFEVPTTAYPSLLGIEDEYRQGNFIELVYGLGTTPYTMFLGYMPSVSADRQIDPENRTVEMTAYDLIGTFQDYTLTLGDQNSSFATDPGGYEIGALIGTLINEVRRRTTYPPGVATFTLTGISGTGPKMAGTQITIDPDKALYGNSTVKAWIDAYTAKAFDESRYPETPLFYTYQQRGSRFVWAREKRTTGTVADIWQRADLHLTIGYDAVVTGNVSRRPVFTDGHVVTSSGKLWEHADRDSSRRWGGKRFQFAGSTSSTYEVDAQTDAVRAVETRKLEVLSFSVAALRDAFILYPGDTVALENLESVGLRSGVYRVSEVSIAFQPVPKTIIVLGEVEKRLTDYLA